MDLFQTDFRLPWETGVVGAILSGGPIVASSPSESTSAAYHQWMLERVEEEDQVLSEEPVDIKRKSIEAIGLTLEETAMSRKRRRGAFGLRTGVHSRTEGGLGSSTSGPISLCWRGMDQLCSGASSRSAGTRTSLTTSRGTKASPTSSRRSRRLRFRGEQDP